MKNLLLLSFALLGILVVVVYAKTDKESDDRPIISGPMTPLPYIEEESHPPKEDQEDLEPAFEDYPPVRSVDDLGKVLSDIEGHMPAGHIYKDSDKITWGHECSHGIHSNLRMKFSRVYDSSTGVARLLGDWVYVENKPVFKSSARINGFYVLEDRAIILNEPDITIQQVASNVPQSLRGGVYQLYLVNQAQSWGDTPLYIFDEWVAYTNGSEVRLDLGIKERSESVLYMLEFNVYALCLAMTSKSEDEKFKTFVRWHLERTMELYKNSKEKLGNAEKHDNYLNIMRTSSDADELRNFSREYLGKDWCLKILEF